MKVTPYQVGQLAELNRSNAEEFAALKAATTLWPAKRLLRLQRNAKRAERLAREIERGVKRGDLEAHGVKGHGERA